jgi:hypothetical protein
MAFGFVWIESLAISLLWVAVLSSQIARSKEERSRRWIDLVGALLPLILIGICIGAAAVLRFAAGVENNWFNYSLSLGVTYLIGAVVILRRARRRAPSEAACATRNLPRGRLLLAFGLSLAVGVATVWSMDVSQRRQATEREARAIANFASLAPPSVPDADNAALIYEKVFARIDADSLLKGEDSPLSQDGLDAKAPVVVEMLKRHDETIALLRRACQLPGCRFNRNWSQPSLNVFLPNLKGARAAAEILQLNARNELANGDADLALSDIDAMFRLAGHIGKEPTIVALLVANGIDHLGYATLQNILPALSSSSLLSRLVLPSPADIRQRSHRALCGEECFVTVMFSKFEEGLPGKAQFSESKSDGEIRQVQNLPAPITSLIRLFFFSRGIDEYHELMEGYRSAADKPYFQARNELDQLAQRTIAVRHGGLILSLFVSPLSHMVVQLAESQADSDCARAAVAATRYRLDHGTLPSQLADLVPAYLESVPLDPFDGKPLRLVVRNKQWTVYSIGSDLHDDGGIPLDLDNSATFKNHDLTFSLKIAKKRWSMHCWLAV